MPNKWEHILAGALIGGFCMYCYTKISGRQLTQEDILKASLVGGLGGFLPDLLEPADNPRHRKFFHSIALMLINLYGNQRLMENPSIDEETKKLLYTLNAGYLSHLVLDSETTAGLPIIN